MIRFKKFVIKIAKKVIQNCHGTFDIKIYSSGYLVGINCIIYNVARWMFLSVLCKNKTKLKWVSS